MKCFLILLCVFIHSTCNLFAAEPVLVGAEQTEKYLDALKNKKVGLIVNHTSYVDQVHLVDTLISLGIDVATIFTPEHGFKGTKDAGEQYDDGTYKSIPLVSLYGKNKKPSKEVVQSLDIIVYDIQDVGVRFYTYISTLHYVMQVASQTGTDIMVLDRPNPNIDYVGGPIIDSANMSFVGVHAIPVVYGMTVGELSRMVNQEGWLQTGKKVNLKVIFCANYTRASVYELPILPSPNLPNQKSVRWYPTLGLFEGTVVSAGRGTEIPFQCWGHPDFTSLTYTFVPQSNIGSQYPKFEGQKCYGMDLSKTNLWQIPNFNLEPLIKAYQLSENKKTFFNNYLSKLIGNSEFQKMIEQGKSAQEIESLWKPDIEAFIQKREPYLIYSEY